MMPEKAGLSVNERKILGLLAKGRTVATVATEMRITYNTADTYVRRIYRKLGVHSRAEAVAWFCRNVDSPLSRVSVTRH